VYTKVKLFQAVVSISPGASSQSGDFQPLEERINEFLMDNPRAKPVDIKLTSNAASVGNTVTNYGLVAMLIYEEG